MPPFIAYHHDVLLCCDEQGLFHNPPRATPPSFWHQRSPLSRNSPLTHTYSERDGSDEDSGVEEELLTAFDEFGTKRLHEQPKPHGPLVIPALQIRDWRTFA
ncbi:hypothetical protein BD311DRAFT_812725 [Dichomitus squalens]|uniref:Uncharacterized protein n=1 Tax=Dichomitus squalens TaxID=114155 RepID=A0A4Q9M2Q3_9APHY|nr:hypothetical protein BD311DRAFT_812725 [Dichomitus squalens]